MRRTGRAGGFRHLQVRAAHFDLSFKKQEARARDAVRFLYVCRDESCRESTRILNSDRTAQECCGQKMMCRKVGPGGRVVAPLAHSQKIWVCTACPVPPARGELPAGTARGCDHEFFVYATLRASTG